MSRSFTSSDPAKVAKFCARPLSSQLTTFTASEVTALMEAADMANATIAAKDASLQSMAAANEDLRHQLAEARAWGERGWARVKLLESKIDGVREVIR